MGDFNAKHSSRGCDVDTSNHPIQRSGYRILAPPTPTRYGHDSASTLDLAISTNVDWPCTVTSISELNANTPEDIDEQIAAFTDQLHQAYTNASKPLKHNDTFYISRDLNQLFKERNRARKIWHYTRSPADKNTLNRLQKQIKKIVIKHEQKQWDESLACLEAEDGSLWKAARDSRKKAPPIPALKGPAKIAYSDADKRKDPTQAESFRPIALPSILGKVAEKIILNRLYHHVEENNILIPEQHGFRPDLSTTHQLLRVVETIKSGFKNKNRLVRFPRYSKSLRSRLARRSNFQINQV
ncbi:putative RNA-directed DNA polymerase from transposon X-element [Trichonephila clavipes]|nr:putative RNA-directed DNA polymerase from transposon X-element [Trichonephila clavipes]